MEDISVVYIVSTLGFVLGGGLGAVVQRTHFCTMGAISDIYFLGDWNRFRSWLLAIAIAVLCSQLLQINGVLDLGNSIYLSSNLGWAGGIIGGIMFGFGMTIAGGCGNKTLVRLGAGNLKSLVVFIFIGIFAYMTLRGLIGLGRVELEALTIIDLSAYGMETQSIPDILGWIGMDEAISRIITTAIVSGGLIWFCLGNSAFRASKADVFAGTFIGLIIPAAWYVTGVIGYDDFDPTPMASFTFIAPVGDALQYLMTFTGSTINFSIAVVGGVIFGSFLAAKSTGEFKLEAFNGIEDLAHHMIGGALMGVGGVLALGCTVGQGITGMSTLAIGSLIALLSIIFGCLFGLKYLEEGNLRGAFGAIFKFE